MILFGIFIILALMVGHFEGYLMGTKVKNLTQIKPEPIEKPLDPRNCVCGHKHTSHESQGMGVMGDGNCTTLTETKRPDGTRYTCACKFYIPQPDPAPKPGLLEL